MLGAATFKDEESEVGGYAATSDADHDGRGVGDEGDDDEEDQGGQDKGTGLDPRLLLHELELLGLV